MNVFDSILQMIGFAELKVGFTELKVYEVRGVKVMLDASDRILRSKNFTSKNNSYFIKSSFLRN